MNKLIIVSLVLTSCVTNKSYVKRSDIAIQKNDTLYVLNKEVGPTIVAMWNEKKPWGDSMSAKLVDSMTFTKMMKRVTPVK